MKRLISIASAALLTVFGLVASTGPTRAKVPGPNGQITFQRFDPSTRAFAVYRVNPDGSHLELVFDTGADGPHWSPDANHRLSIWGVNPNGTGLHQIPIPRMRWRVLEPPIYRLPRSRLVARWDEDRLHATEPIGSEHLHREPRRERSVPGHQGRVLF
jgi:hypothetical protein